MRLAVALAEAGATVTAVDGNAWAVSMVERARMPFSGTEALATLRVLLADGRLTATTRPAAVAGAETFIIVVVRTDDIVSLEAVIDPADLLVITTPHRQHASLATDKPLADVFGAAP
jgi:UDP-glucose 6-dehydrogenase